VSNICNQGYIRPQTVLSTFSPLLKQKTISLKVTLLMLFLNAVSEAYYNKNIKNREPFYKSQQLIQKFIPIKPIEVMSIIVGGIIAMNSPGIIQILLYYIMFSNLEKAFSTFLKQT
ncbi:hypothetical protein P171DRAFT_373963, partial [Karstenula rhodostoma CBS 690.94]